MTEGDSGRTKRVGVFGAGKMAMHHIKAIGLLRGARVIAVADPYADQSLLKGIIPDDVAVYSSATELLEKEKPDIVHVCTPPATHAELAKLALRCKADVYLEKPFALTAKEAGEIVSLAKEVGRKVCAGHQLLFESHMAQVKEQLEKIGKIVHVESYFSFKPVRRSMDGRTTMPPIDQLIDIFPHPVYLLQYFLKRKHKEDVPIEIQGLQVKTDGNVHAVLSCGDAAGILVVTLTGRPIESYVKVIGTNGSLCAEFVRGTFVTNPGPGVSGISKVIFPYSQAWQNATRTTKALYRRLRKKQKSYPGLLELFEAFYRSLEPGKEDVLSASSIVETVTVCEEVGKRLKILEERENHSAEAEFRRKETEEISPVDTAKGAVLVTGGTGMLGRAVAKELRGNGYGVRTISRKNQLFSKRIPGVEYFVGDLGGTIPPTCLQGDRKSVV